MNKVDYTYTVVHYKGVIATVIIDLVLGNVSVTNSIEDVVEKISKQEKTIEVKKHLIIYCDSSGIFDGYDQETKTFVFLGCSTWKDAIEKYSLQQSYK